MKEPLKITHEISCPMSIPDIYHVPCHFLLNDNWYVDVIIGQPYVNYTVKKVIYQCVILRNPQWRYMLNWNQKFLRTLGTSAPFSKKFFSKEHPQTSWRKFEESLNADSWTEVWNKLCGINFMNFTSVSLVMKIFILVISSVQKKFNVSLWRLRISFLYLLHRGICATWTRTRTNLRRASNPWQSCSFIYSPTKLSKEWPISKLSCKATFKILLEFAEKANKTCQE